MSSFEQIGGEYRVRAIIDEFVERVCGDTMIGFFFGRVDRARLKQLEYEHAARFLGADIPYTGRELAAAHKRHPILGGHFARRRTLLRQTLERHGLPAELVEAWLAHQDALRDQVTQDDLTQCTDTRYTETSGAGVEACAGAREQDDEEKP